MARPKRMPTIWGVPDELWERIAVLIDQYDPPKRLDGRVKIPEKFLTL